MIIGNTKVTHPLLLVLNPFFFYASRAEFFQYKRNTFFFYKQKTQEIKKQLNDFIWELSKLLFLHMCKSSWHVKIQPYNTLDSKKVPKSTVKK